MPDDTPNHDLAGKHPALAGAPGGAQAPDTPGGDPARCGPEHGLREGTGAGGEDSRDTRPGNATRYVETTRGILSYAELAPLLAERVALVELVLYEDETFAAAPLDEHLLLDLHRRIAGELVPEWAGRWRDIAVTVGRLEPPQPFQIPMLMRDSALDLQARWSAATSEKSDLLLEFLAFAQGRFLASTRSTISTDEPSASSSSNSSAVSISRASNSPRRPMQAGRSISPPSKPPDRRDLQPLVDIWRERFAHAEAPEA
jgi:CRISPR-associated endonuclease/helicase Cas3